MHNKVKYIVNHQACLGCGLCLKSGTKSSMKLYNDGYYHPSENAFIDENMQKYCPGYGIYQKQKKSKEIEYLYGPIVAPVLAGHIINEDINFKASSGGIITGLLLTLLQNKWVDAILQVRQSKEDPTKSEPCLSTTEEEIIDCMGSRYAPCSLFEHLDDYLATQKRLAVVGKPCDIAALKAYMKIYPEKTKNIIYTFSMMCMGLPSHNATMEMLRYLGAEGKQIASLRYRGYGWPGMATVKTSDGYTNECTYIQSWGAILGRDTLFRCKLCPNGFGEFADISCGDAWYCKNGEPIFNNKEKGRSFIFIRTENGKKLVNQAIDKNIITAKPYNLNEMPIIQKSQYQRKTNLLSRYIIYKLFINPHFKLEGFHLIKLAQIAGIISITKDARGFLGRWWRGYKGHSK